MSQCHSKGLLKGISLQELHHTYTLTYIVIHAMQMPTTMNMHVQRYLVYTVQQISPELDSHHSNVSLGHDVPDQRHLHIEGSDHKSSCLECPWQQQIAQVVIMVMFPACEGEGRV